MFLMKFAIASINDLDRLYDFYNTVIDHQTFDEYGAGWTKDVYPDIDTLKEKIERGLFFIACERNEIIAAAAVTLHEDEIYKKGKWQKKLKDDEIAVLHLFAVHPECRRKGISGQFLKRIIEETGRYVKAIHLDFVKGNLPALKAYEKAGFIHVDEIEAFYEDTGDIIVELMEYDY